MAQRKKIKGTTKYNRRGLINSIDDTQLIVDDSNYPTVTKRIKK